MEMPAGHLELTALGARRINTDTDPEELVLPAASQERLRRIAGWLVQPAPVMREWGLYRYIDGGLRALFRGESGTGKTMAAIAIGRWTDRPLFRVNLDAARDFDGLLSAAEKEKAILLVDEVNAGLGSLLRALEPYEGLAILTTSEAGALAPDAATRLDGIVDFPMPDEGARHEIWRKLLASTKLGQSEDIDAQALASRYALSGADILRSIRIAALLAASEGKLLDMDLLSHSAEERMKMHGDA
jgi:SpoVK/Ycf46/Vps4 family AAA+-type ATPase